MLSRRVYPASHTASHPDQAALVALVDEEREDPTIDSPHSVQSTRSVPPGTRFPSVFFASCTIHTLYEPERELTESFATVLLLLRSRGSPVATFHHCNSGPNRTHLVRETSTVLCRADLTGDNPHPCGWEPPFTGSLIAGGLPGPFVPL
jgi:hypothetical protein